MCKWNYEGRFAYRPPSDIVITVEKTLLETRYKFPEFHIKNNIETLWKKVEDNGSNIKGKRPKKELWG